MLLEALEICARSVSERVRPIQRDSLSQEVDVHLSRKDQNDRAQSGEVTTCQFPNLD